MLSSEENTFEYCTSGDVELSSSVKNIYIGAFFKIIVGGIVLHAGAVECGINSCEASKNFLATSVALHGFEFKVDVVRCRVDRLEPGDVVAEI